MRLHGCKRLGLVSGVLLRLSDILAELVVAGADQDVASRQMFGRGLVVRLTREVNEIARMQNRKTVIRGICPKSSVSACGSPQLLPSGEPYAIIRRLSLATCASASRQTARKRPPGRIAVSGNDRYRSSFSAITVFFSIL